MLPHSRFGNQDREFWAHVKLISEHLGYADRRRRGTKQSRLRRFTVQEIADALSERNLATDHVIRKGHNQPYGNLLNSYLNYRAGQLENVVEPNLMNRSQAQKEFNRLWEKLKPKCNLPMNKQKKEKRHHAFLTCIVNMLTEDALGGVKFDDNPRGLITITDKGRPLKTFSRWMDGVYPSVDNPIAVWETKEYYGTTTFGSRVADGVYETMLDGEELRELREHEGRHILHYLIVDDHFTWWEKGKSYLCRIVDMLHMGLVDEVLFGREVLTRWRQIVKSWPTK